MRCICADLNVIGIVEGVTANHSQVENPNSSQLSIQVNSVENLESKVILTCQEILKKIPTQSFNLDSVRSRYPIVRENS
jgi:hypothetical protein